MFPDSPAVLNISTELWAQCASPLQLRNISRPYNPWRPPRNRRHPENQLRQMSKAKRNRPPLPTIFMDNRFRANPVLLVPLRALSPQSQTSPRALLSTKTGETGKAVHVLHPPRYPATKTSRLQLLSGTCPTRNRGNITLRREPFCRTSSDQTGNSYRHLIRTTLRCS